MQTADKPDSDKSQRLGFLTEQIEVPDDFDQMGKGEIEKLFEGDKPDQASE